MEVWDYALPQQTGVRTFAAIAPGHECECDSVRQAVACEIQA
jgi:hypothetical protein